MSTLSDIKDAIQGIAHQQSEQRSNWHVAKVVSVDSSMETCSVECYNAVWSDVRLTAIADSKTDFHIVPSINSIVVVADLSNGNMSDLAVVLFSKVERICIGTAEHTAANADVLKKQLDILSQRVDTIYDAIKNAKPTTYDGGAGLQSTMVAILNSQTDKEDWSNIQNDKIKHG